MMMANLQIKNLPDHVHAELRRRARTEGLTVRAYVQRLIEADQALPSRAEWLGRVRARRPVEVGVPVADLVAADRDERTPRRQR
jgi:plasmid stability protein